MGRVEFVEDFLLVLGQPALEPMEHRAAVAGLNAHGAFLDVAGQVEVVLLPVSQRLIGQRVEFGMERFGQLGIGVTAVGRRDNLAV